MMLMCVHTEFPPSARTHFLTLSNWGPLTWSYKLRAYKSKGCVAKVNNILKPL